MSTAAEGDAEDEVVGGASGAIVGAADATISADWFVAGVDVSSVAWVWRDITNPMASAAIPAAVAMAHSVLLEWPDLGGPR